MPPPIDEWDDVLEVDGRGPEAAVMGGSKPPIGAAPIGRGAFKVLAPAPGAEGAVPPRGTVP